MVNIPSAHLSQPALHTCPPFIPPVILHYFLTSHVENRSSIKALPSTTSPWHPVSPECENMIRKRVETNDYDNPSGQDGLGHDIDVGYYERSRWSARIGDLKDRVTICANGGIFLEQYHVRFCFFGYGRNPGSENISFALFEVSSNFGGNLSPVALKKSESFFFSSSNGDKMRSGD
jgi:hypothetical protein